MRDIKRAAEFLVEIGLLDWDRVARLSSLPVSSAFNEVALDASARYEEVFIAGLKLRQFNFCLNDYSYFQLSSTGDSLRFCFYPNPFIMSDELVELIEDPADFNAFDLAELIATNRRSPVRYDLAPGAHVPCQHPYAHFHFGHGELGRLAARRVLSADCFCLIVTKLFYPDKWDTYALSRPDDQGFENKLDRYLAKLIEMCALLDSERFTATESRLLHVR